MYERYETPSIKTIGRVQDLTQTGTQNKCAGSGDSILPLQQVTQNFSSAACPPGSP